MCNTVMCTVPVQSLGKCVQTGIFQVLVSSKGALDNVCILFFSLLGPQRTITTHKQRPLAYANISLSQYTAL